MKKEKRLNIRRARLRKRILLRFGVLFAALLTLFAAVLRYGIPFTPYGGVHEHYRQNALQYLNLVADAQKEKLTSWLTERRSDAKSLALNPLLARALSRLPSPSARDDINRYLNQVKNTYKDYHRIEILNAETGRLTAESSDGLSENGAEFSPLPLTPVPPGQDETITFEAAPRSEDLFLIIRRELPPIDGSNGSLRTAVRLAIHTRTILAPLLMIGAGLGDSGEALLFTSDRRLITPLRRRFPGKTPMEPLKYILDSPLARIAAEGAEGCAASVDYRNVPVLAAFRNISITSGTRWCISVKQDEREIFAPFRRTLISYGFIGGAFLLAALLLTQWIARAITRPLNQLTQAVLQVKSGDLNTRLVPGGDAETAILSEEFNAMMAEIRQWRNTLELQVNRRTAQLTQSNADLQAAITRRVKSEHQKELLLREIHHRVKNNMQVIVSLMKLQSQAADNEEVQNVFRNTRNRVSAMALAHELLYRKPELDEIDCFEYFTTLVNNLNASYDNLPPPMRIETAIHADVVFLKPDTLIPCGLIVNELVSNSLKHAFPEGFTPKEGKPLIRVELRIQRPNEFLLSVSDNGRGLPADLDLDHIQSLGLQLVPALVSQLEGELAIVRENGVHFTVTFSDTPSRHFPESVNERE